MSIRPQDLPELRAEVVHFHATHGPAFFDLSIRAGKMPVRPNLETHAAAQHLAKAEAQRVLLAELYWVDSNMGRLAMTAAQSLPSFTLMPEDLPSLHGFMVFSEPICVFQEPETQVMTHITAVSWGPWTKGFKWPSGGLWVSWYSHRDLNLDSADESFPEEEKALMRSHMPLLGYAVEEQYPFSREHMDFVDPYTGEQPDKGSSSQKYELSEFLRVIWLLMQQPLTEISDIEPDRATRKRLRRANHDPRPVRVIELRRPKRSTAESGDTSREYHHQWIVRGHWRQHWHPKRQVHRPVWIAPHIKGPEGAPLIGGEKVYALKR